MQQILVCKLGLFKAPTAERAGALYLATALAIFPPQLCTVGGEKHIMLCAVCQCWVMPFGERAVGMKPKINFQFVQEFYHNRLSTYDRATSRHRHPL